VKKNFDTHKDYFKRENNFGPYALHDPKTNDLCDKGRLISETFFSISQTFANLRLTFVSIPISTHPTAHYKDPT
jgi:hypothetical protein